jgi:hypothetical protein
MRKASRPLVALGVSAIAVIGSQCKPAHSCTQVGCGDEPVIELRVKASPSELASDTFHVCRNTVCIEDLVGAVEARGDAGAMDESGDWATGSTRFPGAAIAVQRATGGWSNIRIRYFAAVDEFLPDGDRYLVEVRSPTANVVASLDRQILYAERRTPNGESCPGHCTSGTLRGYPESAPNLTCSSIPCQSGARFALTAPYDSYVKLYSGSLWACRNDVCTNNFHRAPGAPPFTFAGDLAGFTLDITSSPGQDGVISMTFLEDPSLLANGDVYSLKRGPDPSDEVIFEQTVNYEERFPNGPACDVHPCRSYGLAGYRSP